MRFIDCFIPFFVLLRQFQQQPAGDSAAIDAQLDKEIMAARRSAHDAGYGQVDINEAVFAIVVWADEILLAANWRGALEWQARLLQRRYYGISNGGLMFFERLAHLDTQQLAVREVYYLCLKMGFTGRYGYERNQKTLIEIERTNLALLLPDEKGLSGTAFPASYAQPLTDTLRGVRRRWSLLRRMVIILGVPVLGLLLLYGVYQQIIWRHVNTILLQLN